MAKRIWYRSKSVWLGILTCISSVLSFAQGHELVANNPAAVSVIGFVVGCLIIICRYLTSDTIRTRK